VALRDGTRLRAEQHAHGAARHRVADRRLVARLQAEERLLPVAQHDLVAGLRGESQGGFDRAVPTADDEQALAAPRLCIDQRVVDLRQALTGHAELAGRAAATEGEAHVPRAELAGARRDDEPPALPTQTGEARAEPDRQLVLRGDPVPDLDELLLLVARLGELAVQREDDRLRHHQLVAWIRSDRSAEHRLLLDPHGRDPELARAQQAGQSRGPRADHEELARVLVGWRLHHRDGSAALVRRRCLATRDTDSRTPCHRVGDGRPLRDRRADQREARELARHEEPGYSDRLQLLVQRRQVLAIREVAEGQGDRADRAGIGTGTVTHATGAVHDRGLAVHHREHAVLGAGVDTGSAADALREFDVRMEQPGRVAADALRLLPFGKRRRGTREFATAQQEHAECGDQAGRGKRRQEPGQDLGHGWGRRWIVANSREA
jgi:hypothetical protein